jgi:hypothetical protein
MNFKKIAIRVIARRNELFSILEQHDSALLEEPDEGC